MHLRLNYYYSKQSGFTLIEIMVTSAVIGILTTISFPTYQYYVKKATYTEIIDVMSFYKVEVSTCYIDKLSLSPCDSDSVEMPRAFAPSSSGVLNSLTVVDGVVTAAPNNYKGIVASENCILTPVAANGTLTWTFSGGCVAANYVKN